MSDKLKQILSVKNLKTYFTIKAGEVKAVDDVSFDLEEGGSIGLVGESGCGKTTTALSVIKLLPEEGRIAGGDIIYKGENLAPKDEEDINHIRWKEISMIFQGAMNALNPVKKISEQIMEPILLHEDVTREEARKRTMELFELVELDKNLIDSYPHEFSGGMRQRAVIAMALANNPSLIIADEPTTALDVMVQAQIIDLINSLRKKLNMSLIMITHDLSIIAETCDEIAVMYAGKIVEKGKTEEIIKTFYHPYTDKLLHAFPNIYKERIMVDSIPGDPPLLFNPPKGCRFAERCHCKIGKICDEKDPPLIDITGEGHFVACHARGVRN